MIKFVWPETKYMFEHQVTNLFPIISQITVLDSIRSEG